MCEKKPITVWKRFNKDSQKYEHNHIEDGHSGSMQYQYAHPKGTADQTKEWSRGKWLHEHKHLQNNVVVE